MNEQTWARLDEEFREFPMVVAGPVEKDELDAAARTLGVTFDENYAEFVRRHGGAIVGSDPVFGLRQADAMGSDAYSVVTMTSRLRDDGWKCDPNGYAISMDGAGNLVYQAPGGKVFVSNHETGEVTDLAENFESFLLQLLDG